MSRTDKKRITELTDAQRAAMPAFAEAAIADALDCRRADRALAEDGMRRCYLAAGLPWPGRVVWVDSPIVGAAAFAIAGSREPGAVDVAVGVAVHGAVRDAVYDAVSDAVGVAVGVAVGGAVGGAVSVAVRGAVGGAVGVAVSGAVADAVRGAVRGAVDDAVSGAVDDAVDGAVGVAVDVAVSGAVGVAVDGAVHVAVNGAVGVAVAGAVNGAVNDAVNGAVNDAVNDAVNVSLWSSRMGGHMWPAWRAWRRFFRDVCRLELAPGMWDRLTADDDAAEAGWWWPHRDYVIACDRPVHIHLEAVPGRGPGWGSHRLHSATGQSIRWADGWGLWHWHGQQVPRWAIESDDPRADIAKETNTEVRRAAIERWGWDRWLSSIDATPVSVEDDPGNPGHVLRLFDLPRDMQGLYGRTPVRLLVMENASRDRDGSRRTFAETVPVGVPDAVSAAAWQFGVEGSVYRQLARAT